MSFGEQELNYRFFIIEITEIYEHLIDCKTSSALKNLVCLNLKINKPALSNQILKKVAY